MRFSFNTYSQLVYSYDRICYQIYSTVDLFNSNKIMLQYLDYAALKESIRKEESNIVVLLLDVLLTSDPYSIKLNKKKGESISIFNQDKTDVLTGKIGLVSFIQIGHSNKIRVDLVDLNLI